MGPRLAYFGAGLIAESAVTELTHAGLLYALLYALLAVLVILTGEALCTSQGEARRRAAWAAVDRALRAPRRFSMSGRRHRSVP